MLTFGLNTFSCWTAFVATAGSSSMSASSFVTLLGELPKVSDPQASSKSSSASEGQELKRALDCWLPQIKKLTTLLKTSMYCQLHRTTLTDLALLT